MAAHARWKKEFQEVEKCHNLMSWLIHCVGLQNDKKVCFPALFWSEELLDWPVSVVLKLLHELFYEPDISMKITSP